MKNYVITSGKFTEKGNFTGYTALGARVHIHQAQMLALKWIKNEEVKFPFYAVGEVKSIGQLDENQKPKTNADGTPVMVERLTATSVFSAKSALIDAFVDERTIDLEISGAVSTKAKALGLSDEAIASLESASV